MNPASDPRSALPLVCLAVAAVALPGARPLAGQAADPDPARYADAIEAFEEWDSKNTAPENAILFVGSSSIRFWPTAEWFPDRKVINRGFGGSHISDVNHYIDETVLRHAPDVIVFYAGDNDVAAGKTPAQVLEDYRQFVRTVLDSNPGTQIVFVSIKPSLARWDVWPVMKEANARIRSYSADRANLHYADVAPPLLGDDGRPVGEYLRDDGLHLTPAGYEAWTRVVDRSLEAIGR